MTSTTQYDVNSYKKAAEAALKAFNDACNQLSTVAATYKLHPDHVGHLQAMVQKRSKDLVKQIAFEHSDVETSLPELTKSA